MQGTTTRCKTCLECGITKDTSDFYRDRQSRDGFRNRCKSCERPAAPRRPKEYAVVHEKTCGRCKEVKSASQFYKNAQSKDDLALYCKDCERESRNRRAARDNHYRRKFGMSLGDYERLLSQQSGRCRICKTPDPGHNEHFDVDHCHQTGKVRGLLCNKCNQGIGMMDDDPERLRAAAEYLRRAA